MLDISSLIDSIPEELHRHVEKMADEILISGKPMRLCIAGSFSCGKSSLLNMLTDSGILPTALEETTALPTFIEYGDSMKTFLIHSDGEMNAIDAERFRESTVTAPEGISCSVLQMPVEWLKGMTVIDLPGLGSVSEERKSYTSAQIRLSDVILYVLTPRGPDLEDMEALSLVYQYGKRLKIVVSRYDEIEESVKRGEKAPDPDLWSRQIEEKTGIRSRLCYVSKSGYGKDEIVDFFERSKNDLEFIREQRFRSEIRPLIQNAIGQNLDEQKVCMAVSENETALLHSHFVEKKQELIAIKSDIFEKQNRDRDSLKNRIQEGSEQIRGSLNEKLHELLDNLKNNAGFAETFSEQGYEHTSLHIIKAARFMSEISTAYGKLDIPEAEIEKLNLRLPEPEIIDMESFVDVGHLERLQNTLAEHQQNLEKATEKNALMPVNDIHKSEDEYYKLLDQKNRLQSMPLPKIIQKTENDGKGAFIGRAIGEIADIGLIMVNPGVVGAKVANYIGKGSKFAKYTKIAVEAGKVAESVTVGLDVVQKVKRGEDLFSKATEDEDDSSSATGDKADSSSKEKKTGSKLSPILEKLGFLEMLSLGYWGERVGRWVDGEPKFEEITNPEAMYEYKAAMNEIDSRISACKRDMNRLIDIENEHRLSGAMLEESQKKIKDFEKRINDLKADALRKKEQAQLESESKNIEILLQQAEKALKNWIRNYDSQIRKMSELLLFSCRKYWEDEIAGLVSAREKEMDELSEKLEAIPERKKNLLQELRLEHEQMIHTLDIIK